MLTLPPDLAEIIRDFTTLYSVSLQCSWWCSRSAEEKEWGGGGCWQAITTWWVYGGDGTFDVHCTMLHMKSGLEFSIGFLAGWSCSYLSFSGPVGRKLTTAGIQTSLANMRASSKVPERKKNGIVLVVLFRLLIRLLASALISETKLKPEQHRRALWGFNKTEICALYIESGNWFVSLASCSTLSSRGANLFFATLYHSDKNPSGLELFLFSNC